MLKGLHWRFQMVSKTLKVGLFLVLLSYSGAHAGPISDAVNAYITETAEAGSKLSRFLKPVVPTLAGLRLTEVNWIPENFARTPEEVRAKLDKIATSSYLEKDMENLVVDGDRKDVGLTTNLLYEPLTTILKGIREKYEATGARVPVADLGSAYGAASLRMLMAGASVTALESSERIHAELVRRISEAQPVFLREGETLPKVFRSLNRDLMARKMDGGYVFDAPILKDSFEFIWAGNLMHFFAPSEAKKALEILFRMARPGAQIALTMDSVVQFSKGPVFDFAMASDFALSEMEKGAEFPGYVKTIFRKSGPIKVALSAEKPEDETMPIGFGFQTDSKHPELSVRVNHLYDHKTLTRLLNSVGFLVEEIWYSDSINVVPVESVPAEREAFKAKNTPMKLMVIARKPRSDAAMSGGSGASASKTAAPEGGSAGATVGSVGRK